VVDRECDGGANKLPEQTIRILVGFPPGVALDITSRLLADKYTDAWGKPVVVENVTGAGGNIAVERVANAAPDGYTLAMGGNAALVINPNLYDRLNYDPGKDFACIAVGAARHASASLAIVMAYAPADMQCPTCRLKSAAEE
jgi:tripartite-type tricarboxylate transporter receptor subunit TctC